MTPAGGTASPGVRERLPSLTSLRWLAATAVFMNHADLRAIGVPATGVSFFFILSGFVLTWAHREGISVRTFARRRFARIYPAYFVVTAVAIPLLIAIDRITTRGQLVRALFTFTLLQAWIPSPRWYYAGNGVSWSLSAEACFYAAFPILIALLSRARARTVMVVTVAALAFAITWPLVVRPETVDAGFGFWLVAICPPVRLVEFVIGMGIALLVRQGSLRTFPLGVAGAIAVGAYVIGGEVPIYARHVATTVLPYALLVLAAAQADLAERTPAWLRHPAMLRLGAWSYAMYLVHELVLRTSRELAPGLAVWPRALLCYGVATATAALVYEAVERPFERRWRRAAPRADG